MKRVALTAPMLFLLPAIVSAADTTRKTVWEGKIHLGDNAAQFANTISAGMGLQIPVVLDPDKKGQLYVVTCDIQTLAGDGHYLEFMAHYEDDDGPAREYVVETFRLKGDSNNVDVDHAFVFDPLKKLYAKPAYYSLRIKIDTQIKFKLWDDFLLKRIDIEQ
jgi:hypothetical protein